MMAEKTRVFCMAIALAVVLSGAARAANEEPIDGKGRVILGWDEFRKVTRFDAKRLPDGAGQTITLPWKEVEELLDIKIQNMGKTRIEIPWAEFKALLKWSLERKKPEDKKAPPPTDYVISSSDYAGTLSRDGGEFTLTMEIDILKEEGWKRVRLLPATVALKKATLPEGAYLNVHARYYEMMTLGKGKMPVKLTFAASVQEDGGINRLAFGRVPAGTCVLNLTVAGDVKLKVPGAQLVVSKKDAEGNTNVIAALPSEAPVVISWERALPKVAEVPPSIYAETRTLVGVADGMLMCREVVNFNILHSPVRVLTLDVPEGVSILEVTGQRLQDWNVDKGKLQVQLSYDVVGSYKLDVRYERPVAAGKADIPIVRASDAVREKGFLGVVALANVEITGKAEKGASGIDVSELPPEILAMTSQPVLLAYRYIGQDFAIPLSILKHDDVAVLVTIIDSAAFTTMQLMDGRRMTKAIYTVRNNRNQFLRVKMPAGAEIWSVFVSGKSIRPAMDENGEVLIPLVRSSGAASGLAAFPVEVVYVETPKERPAESGKVRVDLPTCAEPIMHVMYNIYLPREGRYTAGWGKKAFVGPLRVVEEFTSLGIAGRQVVQVNAAKQARAIQQQAVRR
ncbi:MAG: hypothetical protein QF662_01725, partial [Phycisphaerae bacterium]|nr:hypothetical protein [Phycisphaerae bacterium]